MSNLPPNWGEIRLGSHIEIAYGKGLPKKQRETHGQVPVYGSNGIVGHHTESITSAPVIIIGRKGSVGAIHYSTEQCWPIDTAFYIDQFPTNIDSNYLGLFLRAQNLANLNIHAAIPGIRRDDLYDLMIPVPFPNEPGKSLEVQRQIVARIEALLAEVREMRKLHEEITADTTQFMNACIQEIFGQQNSHWKTENLSNVAFIQTGIAKGGRYGNSKQLELPYLRVANVQAGYLDLEEIKTISIPEERLERYRLEVGDLLLTEGGDYDKLGRGAIWEGQIDPCIHQNHVFAVRFEQEKVLPRFAEYEMQSRYAKDYFLRVAKKTTNLASINKTQLSNFPIWYPTDLTEQMQIVSYLNSIQVEVSEMQKSQAKDGKLINEVEQAILTQAFRGEL